MDLKRDYVKLVGAKIELEKFMDANEGKDRYLYEYDLNNKIIELSHRVIKRNGSDGHFERQRIRDALRDVARERSEQLGEALDEIARIVRW
jgi:hypothetical protein